MKIEAFATDFPTLLAPMAGYTNHAFRLLCKRHGADMVYTEFVSSEGIIRGSQKTHEYLYFSSEERPIGIQIFGHNPESMAAAARHIADRYRPEIIDLNFGCSVRKVVKKMAGAALLKDLPLMRRIASAVVKAVSIPVTAKIRAGWNRQLLNFLEVGRMLESEGIQALTFHPRSATEGYRRPADWNQIGELKAALKIPVIGNGDITSPEDARRMFRQTGCDAIMIGRGALGNPWLFGQVKQFLRTGQFEDTASVGNKLDMCRRHIELNRQLYGDDYTHTIMKKFYRWYFRGMQDAALIRDRLIHFPTLSEVLEYLTDLRSQVRSSESCGGSTFHLH